MGYDIFGNDIGDIPNGGQGGYGKIGPQQIEQRLGKMISENKEYLKPLYGSGEPLIPPRFIGDTYYDTTNQVVYSAYGLELADWVAPSAGSVNTDTGMKMGMPYAESEGSYSTGRLHGTRVICPYNCTVNKIIMRDGASGAINIKLAIYDDSAGSPNNLLGETAAVTLATNDVQFIADLTTSLNLTANTAYWVTFLSDGTFATYRADTVATNSAMYNSRVYANGFPATFGAITGITYSIFNMVF